MTDTTHPAIEAATRAHWDGLVGKPGDWDDTKRVLGEDHWEIVAELKATRAAIAAYMDATREPSLEMRENGAHVGDDALDRWGSDSMGYGSTFTSESALESWHAMHDQQREEILGK